MLKLSFFLWALVAIGMLSFHSWLIIGVWSFFFFLNSLVRGCDKSKCLNTPTIYSRIFYEEIGCTEVNDSDDCCTVRQVIKWSSYRPPSNRNNIFIIDSIAQNDQPMENVILMENRIIFKKNFPMTISHCVYTHVSAWKWSKYSMKVNDTTQFSISK